MLAKADLAFCLMAEDIFGYAVIAPLVYYANSQASDNL